MTTGLSLKEPLPVDRRADAYLAEEVLGWTWEHVDATDKPELRGKLVLLPPDESVRTAMAATVTYDEHGIPDYCPAFMRDDAAAMALVKFLGERREFSVRVRLEPHIWGSSHRWEVELDKDVWNRGRLGFGGRGETLGMALGRAVHQARRDAPEALK